MAKTLNLRFPFVHLKSLKRSIPILSFKHISLRLLLILSSFLSTASLISAQIVPDNTLSSHSIVDTEGMLQRITGGTSVGNNLFHSFEKFSVLTGETAFFDQGIMVENILSRVTGTSISEIDGILRANGNANLFLLNPNGIIFGKNATLDLGGSFFVTTSDSLIFTDGNTWDTTTSTPPLLTINTPLGVQSGTLQGNLINQANLAVASGQSLRLIGNFVTTRGTLSAPTGQVRVQGHEIELGDGLSIEADEIRIQAEDHLTIADQGNDTLLLSANSGLVELVAEHNQDSRGDVVMADPWDTIQTDGSSIAIAGANLTQGSIDTTPFQTSDVWVESSNVDPTINVPTPLSESQPLARNSGGITLKATQGNMEVYGRSLNTSGTFGNAGAITLEALNQIIIDRSFMTADSKGEGNGGNILIDASEAVVISNDSWLSTDTIGSGQGGNIEINTARFILQNAGYVSSDTYGKGNGGNILINASEAVVISNDSWLSADTIGSGQGGNIEINTAQLTLQNLSSVSSDTYGEGNGGNILINASEAVELLDQSVIFVATESNGNGGNLEVNTPQLIAKNGSGLSADAFSSGRGGNITINADELVALDFSAIFADTDSTGDAGNIEITTQRLLAQDSFISASTFDAGAGGNVTIKATEQIRVAGDRASEIPEIGAPFVGGGIGVTSRSTGDGGNLSIRTHELIVTEMASINASSTGSGIDPNGTENVQPGTAGNITINSPRLTLSEDGAIRANTLGGQGNINIISEDLRLLNQGRISTNAQREFQGGNIKIKADTIVGLDNSDITANATEGFGGTVTIDAQALFGIAFRPEETDPFNNLTSDITATSEAGSRFSGSVEVLTPEVDPAEGLVALPDNVVDVTTLIERGCAVASESSFIITGRGGVPGSPSDMPTSNNVWVDLGEQINRSGTAQFTPAASPTVDIALVEAQGWIIGENGKVRLTANPPGVIAQQSWQPQPHCAATAS
jgi:filamentous hemagglutinin family protein